MLRAFCLLLVVTAYLAVVSESAAIVGSERVSVDVDGGQLVGPSGSAFSGSALSRNANLVAYETDAPVIVELDLNGTTDIIFRNNDDLITEVVSLGVGGLAGNNRSYNPSMSANGLEVAYVSMASDLVEGDTNGVPDIFLRNRDDSTTVRVSVTAAGEANAPSFAAAISANGDTVAFCSLASNLGGGDNPAADAFVYDAATAAITAIPSPVGATGEGCRRVALSEDGNIVAFSYTAGTGAGVTQVFRHDVAAGQTSALTSGDGDSGADGIAITDDGSAVFFGSRATDLVSGDSNGVADVFAWQDGSLTRLSLASDGSEADGDSGLIGVEASSDGRYVVFSSAAANLVANDYNSATDVFRLDRDTGEVRLASVTVAERGPNGPSYSPAISDDGEIVAFASLATDVVYGDRNRQPDLFMRAGNFLDDASLVAPAETPTPYDPSFVTEGDDDGPSLLVIAAGAAAGFMVLLIVSWFVLGRKPKA